MDRKVFEMLEMYRRDNGVREKAADNKEFAVADFCKETNYSPINSEILTMAFVNMQPIESVYETEEGFSQGTIFPNIDKPFFGGGRV